MVEGIVGSSVEVGEMAVGKLGVDGGDRDEVDSVVTAASYSVSHNILYIYSFFFSFSFSA